VVSVVVAVVVVVVGLGAAGWGISGGLTAPSQPSRRLSALGASSSPKSSESAPVRSCSGWRWGGRHPGHPPPCSTCTVILARGGGVRLGCKMDEAHVFGECRTAMQERCERGAKVHYAMAHHSH